MEASRDLAALLNRYPQVVPIQEKIMSAYAMLSSSFRSGGRLLLCGNGGSACDCEHIAGELMKGFLLPRPLPVEEQNALAALGADGKALAKKLQCALPTLSLTGLPALSTAFGNDVDPEITFAQQAYAYARPEDVLMGISTSGNANNVCFAAVAAKCRGAKVIGLTGLGGGKLAAYCDLLLDVPETETYRVQELHLPVYHCLCAMLEHSFFEA